MCMYIVYIYYIVEAGDALVACQLSPLSFCWRKTSNVIYALSFLRSCHIGIWICMYICTYMYISDSYVYRCVLELTHSRRHPFNADIKKKKRGEQFLCDARGKISFFISTIIYHKYIYMYKDVFEISMEMVEIK